MKIDNMMYVFDDASFAQQLREAGFSVVLTNTSGKQQYAVLRDERLDKMIRENFMATPLVGSPVLCF